MTYCPTPTPYGNVVFCDDVRVDTSNKRMFIGVYDSTMNILSELPSVVPKFNIFVSYFERPGESDEPVNIRVFLPWERDTPFVEVPVPVEEMRAQKPADDPEADDPLVGGQFQLEISPFHVLSEGRIKVRAYRGDKEYRLGSLLLRSKPPPADFMEPSASPQPS